MKDKPKTPTGDQFPSAYEDYYVGNLTLEEVIKNLFKEVSGGVIQVTLNYFLEKNKIPLATWFRRMKNPSKFTVEEIESIAMGLSEISKLASKPIVYTPSMILEAIRIQVEKDSKNAGRPEIED